MTADANSIDLPALLETHLQRAEPDLLRSMLTSISRSGDCGGTRHAEAMPPSKTSVLILVMISLVPDSKPAGSTVQLTVGLVRGLALFGRFRAASSL